MYKQIGKIRESLNEKGHKKDIPIDVFCRELMLVFGMRKKTAIEWMHTFSDVDLIKIENDIIIFV